MRESASYRGEPIMRSRRKLLARSAPLVALIGVLGLVGASCAQEPPAPVQVVTFNSLASGSVHLDVFFPGDPEADPPTEDVTIPVDVDLGGTATGTWSKFGAGAFDVSMDLDGGEFSLVADIGTVTVKYSVNSPVEGTGTFNPNTGVGGFDSTAVLTIDEIVGLGPVGQPCDVGLQSSVSGQIDPATGILSATQDSFTVLTPAEDDCGGLGSLFADLLGTPDNSIGYSFRVAAAAPAPAAAE